MSDVGLGGLKVWEDEYWTSLLGVNRMNDRFKGEAPRWVVSLSLNDWEVAVPFEIWKKTDGFTAFVPNRTGKAWLRLIYDVTPPNV